ncbi:MAG: lytic polysaccharide monooxygenase [Kineosporiaceae bacterium]
MLRVHRRTRTHVVALIASTLLASGLAAAAGVALAPAASAHGNVNDPIARGYRCLKLYGGIHLSTSYRDSDPMCWNAFQKSPGAMWNFNGMLVDGLAGKYTSITDICSAGSATYAVLSQPGNWIATPKPAKFKLNLVDGASHGADWMKVYISKDGFDPTTKALGWDDVVQISEIGRIPTSGNGGIVDPSVNGSAYTMDVDATGYPGRRVLFTLWKASHSDQTYYLCSDVDIQGTTSTPTPTTTTPKPTTTTPEPTTSDPVPTTSKPTTTKKATGKVKVTTKCKTGKNGKRTCVKVTKTRKAASAMRAGCSTVSIKEAWPGGYLARVDVDENGVFTAPDAAGVRSVTTEAGGLVVTGAGDPGRLGATCR